jgi:osomolarity two-component system response regulator SKN7
MNDVLAKPFTKHGLFGILDKHLIHLKAIQLSAEVPRSLGLPPLSDQGIADAVANGAAQWMQSDDVRNPLAAMGWSDETYGIVLQVGLSPRASKSLGGSPEFASRSLRCRFEVASRLVCGIALIPS